MILQLGDIEFEDFEVPTSIPFGGGQRLATHSLPGEARVVQAMGRENAPIGWEGTFLGQQATYRARALDLMRVRGQSHILIWHEFLFQVVIETFEANFEAFYRVPYRIGVVVVKDLALTVKEAPQNSLDMTIRRDLIETSTAIAIIDDAPLSELDAKMQELAKGIQDFQRVVHSAIAPVLATATLIRERVRVLQQTAGAALNGAAALVSIVPGMSGSSLAQKLRETSSAAVRLPALQQLDWQILRVVRNLNVADFGASAVARTVAGGTSLFRIASEEFDDARRWDEIARASGRADPMVTRTTQLRIPQ